MATKRAKEDEELEERLLELKSYVDEQLGRFREEVIDYLRTLSKPNEEIKKEILRYIEKLRREILSVQNPNTKVEELEEKINQLQTQLQRLSQLQQGQAEETIRMFEEKIKTLQQQLMQLLPNTRSIEERLLLVTREVIAKEIRAREVERLKQRRKRMLWVLGALSAIAAVITIVTLRYPWLIALIALVLLIWLRR